MQHQFMDTLNNFVTLANLAKNHYEFLKILVVKILVLQSRKL